MKVRLINVADYELKDGKTTQIPFDTFKNLCGYENTESTNEPLREARLFKSFEEFKKLSLYDLEQFDENENIRVMNNGQFIVLFRIPEVNPNAATNTETNKGK